MLCPLGVQSFSSKRSVVKAVARGWSMPEARGDGNQKEQYISKLNARQNYTKRSSKFLTTRLYGKNLVKVKAL